MSVPSSCDSPRSLAARAFRTLLLGCVAGGCTSSPPPGAPPATPSADAGAETPCNPLTPPPVTLGTLLGVGEGPGPTFYLADDVPDSGEQRVFVSSGGTLFRKHVPGSGSNGEGTASVDYTFTFQNNLTDSADARDLLIQVRSDAVTAVALGPAGSRAFYAPDAGDETLTVVDGGAVRGFPIQNLPYLIEYVADASNGETVVVTQAMDPWSSSDERIFYGTADHMVEYPLLDDNRDCCEVILDFSVNGAKVTALFEISSGGLDEPSHLQTTEGSFPLTVRTPTPTSLSGFSFICFG